MDLFTLALNKNNNHRPLADRMRPRSIDEIFGQKHIIGQDKLLSKLIKNDNLTSLILYGPPGVGKTSIAHVISKETKCEFVKINATSIGVKEIRECIDNAESLLKLYGRKTIFFIDEIHALKKGSQQDALLDAVEKGIIILIGATTENPYFDLNGALLSRTKVFQLEPLSHKEIVEILENVLNDKERGYGNIKISVDAASLLHISELCGGDARNAINTLELAVLSSNKDEKGIININKETIEQAMQKSVVNYDATGDNHYDIISAFIKSIRGSNADAALYWFGRMIAGGEDPKFIVRRLIILASEDIGMADANAMLIAMSASNALSMVGLPEAVIPIAEAIIYLSKAPKSNSVTTAVFKALEEGKKYQYPVPPHLRDAHYKGAEQLGHTGYKYPHIYPGHYVEQEYFPKEMGNHKYYIEDK